MTDILIEAFAAAPLCGLCLSHRGAYLFTIEGEMPVEFARLQVHVCRTCWWAHAPSDAPKPELARWAVETRKALAAAGLAVDHAADEVDG